MAVDKLVDSGQLNSDLEDIADAIRAKGGTSAQLAFPNGFVSAIENIPSGGATWETVYNDTVAVTIPEEDFYVGTISCGYTIAQNSVWRITWNGTPYECTATSIGNTELPPYALGNDTIVHLQGGNNEPFFLQKIDASTLAVIAASSQTASLKIEKQVSGGGSTLITKTVTENGTYDAEDDDADGYSSVTVNVESYTWQEEYSGTVSIEDWGEDVKYVWLPNYFETHDAIALGETYRITWLNQQYICVAEYAITEGYGSGYCLGEPTLLGYSHTGNNEPFCGQCFYSNGLMFACDYSLYGSFTLKIEKQVPVGGSTLITKSITQNGTYDAEDDDADGYSSVTVNVSGGGSSFSLLYSSEVNVTTSSTTNTTLTSLSTGITFDNTKVYMVSVRDKAGKRNGYYLGTDTYFLPTTTTNSTVSANMTFYVDSNGEVKWTQTAYGVFLYKYYRGSNMGKIDINSRYSSSYGTINGTFTIKLYEVAIPNALT